MWFGGGVHCGGGMDLAHSSAEICRMSWSHFGIFSSLLLFFDCAFLVWVVVLGGL